MSDPWDNMTITLSGCLEPDDQLTFDYDMSITSLPPLKTVLSGGTLSASLPNTSTTSPGYVYAPGGAGMTLSATGGGGTTWTNQTVTATASPTTVYTINDSSNTWGYANAWGINTSKTLKVDGDAEFEGDITIKGVKLTERLDEIEKRLAILRPNNDLEGKWDELKELGERYRQLEQEILEKEKVWEILKK